MGVIGRLLPPSDRVRVVVRLSRATGLARGRYLHRRVDDREFDTLSIASRRVLGFWRGDHRQSLRGVQPL
jgi:hypothetical protein